MSLAHLLYIPVVLGLGLAVGWMLGGRAGDQEAQRLRQQLAELDREAAALRLSADKERSTRA